MKRVPEKTREKLRIASKKRWDRVDPVSVFWSKVDKSEGQEGCWIWMGVIGDGGYGRTRWKKRRNQRVHRISWSLSFGTIPEDLCVLHSCDNRRCVNPKHLFIGTPKDNIQDMYHKGRHARERLVMRLEGRTIPDLG